MNYIGSKYSLLSDLDAIIDSLRLPKSGIALDLFSGTGAVAQLLKHKGHQTYANDWQHYAYVMASAHLRHNKYPTFPKLHHSSPWKELLNTSKTRLIIPTHSVLKKRSSSAHQPSNKILHYLNNLPGKTGPFYEAYCEGGIEDRLYFSKKNGMKIQAIRDQIEIWQRQELILKDEIHWLIACLLESADRVANTASIYGAYLKKLKSAAEKDLHLIAVHPIASKHVPTKHKTFNKEAIKLLTDLKSKPIDFTYIDPPYNHRQYSDNYHILETLSRWDLPDFIPRGKTGLRPAHELSSNFCKKRRVERSFQKLLTKLTSKTMMISYNNEGLLDEKTLITMVRDLYPKIRFIKIPHKRFKADPKHNLHAETEEILLCATRT